MKKILLAALMAVSCFNLSAQVKIDSIVRDADGRYPAYCTLEMYSSLFSIKKMCHVDIGINSDYKTEYLRIVDKEGKPMVFVTNMMALDYFARRGWTIDQTIFLTRGHSDVLQYILKKMVKSEDEITKGLNIEVKKKTHKYKSGDDMYDFGEE